MRILATHQELIAKFKGRGKETQEILKKIEDVIEGFKIDKINNLDYAALRRGEINNILEKFKSKLRII